jgi:hypothetical protein
MHVFTSLIIFFGFVLVICLGLIQVIWDLSETSTHASPHVRQQHLTAPTDPKIDTPPRVNRRVPGI